MASKAKGARVATSLDLLALPSRVHSRIFACLDFVDALHCSLTCKELLRNAGSVHLRRYVACSSCLNLLCDAATAHTATSEARFGRETVPLDMEDAPTFCLGSFGDLEPSSVRCSDEEACTCDPLLTWMRNRVAPNSSTPINSSFVRVRTIYCRCGLYLGVEIKEIDGVREEDDLNMNNWRMGLLLGRIFVAHPYLTIARRDGREDVASLPGSRWESRVPKTMYVCKSGASPPCDQPLFVDSAILQKSHCWRTTDAHPDIETTEANNPSDEAGHHGAQSQAEAAWYVNNVVGAGVALREPYEADLLQGKMMVTTVECGKCRQELGWKFVACREKGVNAHSVGRWGFVLSRVVEMTPSNGLERRGVSNTEVPSKSLGI